MVFSDLKNSIKSIFKAHKSVLLGFSGGADTSYLVATLGRLNLLSKVIILHFVHGIRPNPIEEIEQIYNCFACIGNFVIFGYRNQNSSSHRSMRIERFSFFYEQYTRGRADALILGHNKNDCIETFIMRLSLGTTIYGLINSLAAYKIKNMNIIRPLQYTKKLIILNNIEPFVYDRCNISPKYLRTHIRELNLDINDIHCFLNQMNDVVKSFKYADGVYDKNNYSYVVDCNYHSLMKGLFHINPSINNNISPLVVERLLLGGSKEISLHNVICAKQDHKLILFSHKVYTFFDKQIYTVVLNNVKFSIYTNLTNITISRARLPANMLKINKNNYLYIKLLQKYCYRLDIIMENNTKYFLFLSNVVDGSSFGFSYGYFYITVSYL